MKKPQHQLLKVLQKIYRLLGRKQKLIFSIIIIIMIASAALTQLTPKAIGWLTDDILSVDNINFQSVIPFLLFILAVNVINETIKIIRRVLVEDTATSTEKKARVLVIRSLLMAPLSYFREHMTGNIHGRLNRCLEGTVKLEKLLFMDFVPAIFNGVAAIIVIYTTLPFFLATVMLLVIPIGVFIVLKQIKSQKGIRVELLETKSHMDGTIVELINGIEVIRVCDSADTEIDRFGNQSEQLRAREMRHHKAMAAYDCLKFINQAVFTVLIIGISTYLATQHAITVGEVLTAYLCFTQLLRPLEELHRIFDEVSECTILADSFFEMTEIPHDFSYLPVGDEKVYDITEEIINVRDLNFRYTNNPEKLILSHFNLDIAKGIYLGIAGPSGCGKSSLIRAICKLEPAEGDIILDDVNLNNLSRADIAELVALVPQTPFLIAGTIRDNITYGLNRTVTDDELREAARRAYILDFIEELPRKFNSVIAEGGGNLSGGQKQRIAIARIFLRKPKILILDEATSALDNTSEKHIQAEIEKLQKENGTTILAIAHRLTTLKNCNRIIVLDHGKIVEDGQFDDLINQEGIFSDMYYGKLNT